MSLELEGPPSESTKCPYVGEQGVANGGKDGGKMLQSPYFLHSSTPMPLSPGAPTHRHFVPSPVFITKETKIATPQTQQSTSWTSQKNRGL